MNKTKLVSTVKYSAPSIALGTSITQIVIFFFPNLLEISDALNAILTFGINIGLVASGVLSDSE